MARVEGPRYCKQCSGDVELWSVEDMVAVDKIGKFFIRKSP